MRNKEKLQGCNNKLIAVLDYLDTEAKRNGYEVIVTSGKRDPATNKAAGGAPKSDHLDGNAADFMYSDKPIAFAHITDLWALVEKGKGVFAYVTKMEVVRDVIDKGKPTARWANHIHFTAMPTLRTKPPIFFTGVYQ